MKNNKSVVVRLNYDLVEKILAYKDFKSEQFRDYAFKRSSVGDILGSNIGIELCKSWESKSLVDVIDDMFADCIPSNKDKSPVDNNGGGTYYE